MPFVYRPDEPPPAAVRDFSESSVAAHDFSAGRPYIEGVT